VVKKQGHVAFGFFIVFGAIHRRKCDEIGGSLGFFFFLKE